MKTEALDFATRMELFIPRESPLGIEICCEADLRRVVQHLKKEFGGEITDKAEGPDSIAWRLLIEGRIVMVSLSDWGDFPLSVSSKDASAEDLMGRIRASLENLAVSG